MCDQRELLIGYLYDECERDERRAVEAHLNECPACREEIAGLRAVRQDLLAWEVPPYRSVWRPFVAERPANPLRAMPAWAMAAAASLVFLAGAAGGVVSQRLLPASAPPAPQFAHAPVATAVTAAELASLKAKMLAEMRAETARQVAAALPATPSTRVEPAAVSSAAYADVVRRLSSVEDWQEEQIRFNMRINNDVGQIGGRYAAAMNAPGMNRESMFVPVNFGSR